MASLECGGGGGACASASAGAGADDSACSASTGVGVGVGVGVGGGVSAGGCWAAMPPELLRDVLSRIEVSEAQWPGRKQVVACAAVCCSWREVTRDLVKTPEASACLTFPVSLKQPGPRDTAIQCFIKRDRTSSTYHLYLGLPPTSVDNGKFLLAARKCRRATSTDYIISLDGDNMSRASNNYVGKLRSNFLGTKFTIFDSQSAYSCSPGAVMQNKGPGRRVAPKVSPKVPNAGGSFVVANIAYELNVLGTRGPRRMQCTLNSIPVSSMEPGGSVPAPTELTAVSAASLLDLDSAVERSTVMETASPAKAKVAAVADCSWADWEAAVEGSGALSKDLDGPLILKNKAPRWHEQLQCWCLNFRGRVTVASVKNFQLVAAVEQLQQTGSSDHDKVLLQFGKIGKDMFTMDYRYPLSAFQAFAICLSSFDTKLACE